MQNKIETVTLIERIILTSILPQKGGYIDNLVKENIEQKLKLTIAEIELFEINQMPNGSITFNKEAENKKFEIDFTEREHEMILGQIKTFEQNKELPTQLNKLYGKLFNPTIPEDIKNDK